MLKTYMQTEQVRIRIAGCPVDNLSFKQTLEELQRRIDARIPTHVVFINVFKIAQFHADERLRATMERAQLLLADGVPVLWASKLLGTPLPGRVNGTDLMESMLELAAARGYGVFLLGGNGSVIARTVAKVQQQYPSLRIAGFRDGYFTEEENDDVVNQINASMADILLLGMSTPRKELWADESLARLKVPICQGVGGSFDVIAGFTRRAPRWMQVGGLEWAYRIMQEPRRLWRRYLGSGITFACLFCGEFVSSLKKRTVQLFGAREPEFR